MKEFALNIALIILIIALNFMLLFVLYQVFHAVSCIFLEYRREKRKRLEIIQTVKEPDATYNDVDHTLKAYIFMWLGKAYMGQMIDKNEVEKVVKEQLKHLKVYVTSRRESSEA